MGGDTGSWDNDHQMMTIPNVELHFDDQSNVDTTEDPTALLDCTETSSTLRHQPDWCTAVGNTEGE